MDFKSKKLSFAIDVLVDFVAAIVYGSGISLFTAPNHIAPGGVSGISTIIFHLTGFPIGVVSFVLNLPLLALAFKFLGFKFSIKTLKTVVITSVVIDYLLVYFPKYTGDPILAALFGGVLVGGGLALVFLRGSTTGGTDIVSRLIQLKHPYIQMGKILLLLDVVVLAVSAIAYKSIEAALYGMISIFVASRIIDSILYGQDNGKLLLIMSAKSGEIAQAILRRIERGVTLLESKGAYSGLEGEVIMCAVRRFEYIKCKNIIKEIDPAAFIIITDAGEILGEGFRGLHESS